MAAYGVIGGIIGGAIALAITPLLRKKLKKNNKKKDKKSQAPRSYRPWGVALFLFLIALGDIIFVVYLFWWMITEGFNLLYIAFSIIMTIIGIIVGCWSGSFLGARMEKTEHVRSEKRQVEGGMGGTKMTIKTRKGLKISLLCQEKTEHVRSMPLKNGAY